MLRERKNHATSMLCTGPRQKEDITHTMGGLSECRVLGKSPGCGHTIIMACLLPGLPEVDGSHCEKPDRAGTSREHEQAPYTLKGKGQQVCITSGLCTALLGTCDDTKICPTISYIFGDINKLTNEWVNG